MATFIKFDAFVLAQAHKKHNLGSDTLKYALTNTAPDPAVDAVLADISEISYTNCSSRTPGRTSSSQTDGVYKLVMEDLTLTASGGPVGPFQWVVFYNDTAADKDVISYWDIGGPVTLADGETLLIDAHPTNGILTQT